MEVEWMRYLTFDQALALLLIVFDFEKHLTLDQVCFYSFEKCSFYRFVFILFTNWIRKQQRKEKLYVITCSWK